MNYIDADVMEHTLNQDDTARILKRVPWQQVYDHLKRINAWDGPDEYSIAATMGWTREEWEAECTKNGYLRITVVLDIKNGQFEVIN